MNATEAFNLVPNLADSHFRFPLAASPLKG